MLKEKISALKEMSLFEDLKDEEIENISRYFHKRAYARNEVVYSYTNVARHLLFLHVGKIKIYRLSELGKEQIIRLIEPYEFTGELAIFEGVRKAYATALEASIVYTIDHKDFKEILKTYPDIALKMIEMLSLRLHLSEEQTSHLSTTTAKERLWLYLNKEAHYVDGRLIVHHTETKRFLASYLGMSSETLSRSLHQLEEEGRVLRVSDHYLEIVQKV